MVHLKQKQFNIKITPDFSCFYSVSSLDMLATESRKRELEDESSTLSKQLHCLKQENTELKKILENSEKEQHALTFDPDVVNTHSTGNFNNLFVYYTGLSYVMFMTLLNFLIPDPHNSPIHYSETRREIQNFTLKQQLFLVLCRLRIGFHLKDIVFRIHVKPQTIGTIFSSWIKFMYAKLGFLSFYDLLGSYKKLGLIEEGDAIMADKGFHIEEHLIKIGLQLNVPPYQLAPYASATSQMRPEDVKKHDKLLLTEYM